MNHLVARVLQRYLTAGNLPMGRTFQNEIVRIHRYRDVLKVVDITNAGKRGKKCQEITIQLTYSYKGDHAAWFDRIAGMLVDLARSGLPAMKSLIKDLLVDFPGEIALDEQMLKAIAVEPYGEVFEFEVPLEGGGQIAVLSSPIDFRITNRVPLDRPGGGQVYYQDTSYHPVKRTDAAAFYAWMKDNHQKIRRYVTMNMFRDMWQHMGINYDYH